jgi:hypothetical protein
MNEENTLRLRAREAMKAGSLPRQRPQGIWGGPGTGAGCGVCGKPVGRDELEFELQFASDADRGAASYHVHVRCFAAWEFERQNGGASNGDSLPRENGNGIMSGRERESKSNAERS